MKRIFLIVLDSLGIGAMPDSENFGDKDVNTLKSISKSPYFNIKNLNKLGLFNIDGIDCFERTDSPKCAYARLSELSQGKDTTIGHWEIAGIISDSPLPTYENGFPNEIINEFSARTGKKVLCNLPYSGTKVLEDYGKAHLESGDLIVYTSADSVFQIAAHTDIVPLNDLYTYCKIAREILSPPHAVGRVIARPFTGDENGFVRTSDRRDFSLAPPSTTMLDNIVNLGKSVLSVGKISDIFAGKGISKAFKSHSNTEGMQITESICKMDFDGICFTNLVDFDSLYGHRNNVDGYAKALSEFDEWLGKFIPELREDDCLIITADHGCDPGDISTDHTREYTPLLIYGDKITPQNLGTLSGFDHIASTVLDMLGIDTYNPKSLYKLIKK